MRCEPVEATAIPAAHGCGLSFCDCDSRRSFLKSFSALGASAMISAPAVLLSEKSSQAQGAMSSPAAKRQWVDVHHHFYPPDFVAEFDKSHERITGLAKRWTIAHALDQMDQAGVATAIWSIPGRQPKALSVEARRKVTRAVNDFAAKGGKDHPGRFGLFAYLPMPDVDGSLKEIEYALDTLKADGIGLFTSYDEKYLGHPAFRPVLEELNRRKCVVYVHPLSPQCCGNIADIPASFTEYPQDTNRTVLSLLLTGTFSQLPDIRWIFSHGGAAIPELAGRVKALAHALYKQLAEKVPKGVDYELQRQYYETANAAYPPNMAALLKYVPVSQVLFGTDYPYIKVTDNVNDLLKIGLSPTDLEAIGNGNAKTLIPRLKT